MTKRKEGIVGHYALTESVPRGELWLLLCRLNPTVVCQQMVCQFRLSTGELRETSARLTALTTNSALLGHQSQSVGGGGGCGERKGKICELFIEARRAFCSTTISDVTHAEWRWLVVFSIYKNRLLKLSETGGLDNHKTVVVIAIHTLIFSISKGGIFY